MVVRKFFLDCWHIFYIQLLEQRSMLGFILFFSIAFPALMVFGLGRIGGEMTYEALLYVISGSAIVTIFVSGISMVTQGVAEMKQNGAFLYYASLPISKASLLVGLLASRVLINIPGLALSLVAGSLLYGTPMPVNPLILLVMALTALSLSGVGAAIGTAAPTQYLASFITQIAQIIVIFAAPVLIPLESLPVPLQITGYLLPPTNAADALRRMLAGTQDLRLAIDLAALAAFGVASLAVTSRMLKWRLTA